MANKIQVRRDTAANWTAANPVLSAGETGYETDTKLTKIGDGTTAWNSLGYRAPVAADLIPKWKASTAYTAGDRVLTPDGNVAKATATFTSASTFNSLNWTYGTDPASVPTIKPSGDTRAGVWEYTHNSTTGYLFHLLAGASFGSPAAILAIGNDNGTGTSILLPNKAGGKCIVIDQQSGVSSSTAYGLHATQSSTLAPLVRLEQNVNGAADAFQVLAFGTPTSTQNLAYFGDPAGEAGTIRAVSGQIEWKRSVIIQDKDGSTASYLDVTENNGVAANTRTHTLIKKAGPEYYGYSGSAGQWWPFAIQVSGSHLKIQGAGLSSTVGTPGTLTNLIDFQNTKIGFFGATPVVQPSRAGALTDSSGGTSGGATIAAVTDVATAANAIATLAAKYNALEAKLSAAGGGLGLTA